MADTTKTTDGAQAPEEKKETTVSKKAEKATTKTTDGEAKVYNFISTNKYLSCTGLGVQFMDGKASTTKLEVAKALVKIDGVELVEK